MPAGGNDGVCSCEHADVALKGRLLGVDLVSTVVGDQGIHICIFNKEARADRMR